jgi:hypothetical protein
VIIATETEKHTEDAAWRKSQGRVMHRLSLRPFGQDKGLAFVNPDTRAATTFLPCRITTSNIMLKFNITISVTGSGNPHTQPKFFRIISSKALQC